MNPKNALKIILVIGFGGLIFSGYLSYNEIFGTCSSGCPVVQTASGMFGLPACVYGFFMYASIVVVTILGLRKKTI